MNVVADGFQGELCLIDDILIFGRDKPEHNERLFAKFRMQRKENFGVTK